MKYTKLIVWFLLGAAFYSKQLNAQTVIVGTSYPTVKGAPTLVSPNVPTQVFRKDDMLIQVKQGEKFQVCIQQLDAVTLKEIGRNCFNYKKDAYFLKTITFKGKIYLSFMVLGEADGKKRIEVIAYELDTKTGAIGPEFLVANDEPGINPAGSWYSMTMSYDSTQLIIKHTYMEKKTQKFELFIMNKDFEVTSARTFTIPGLDQSQQAYLDNGILDRSGNISFLLKLSNDKKSVSAVINNKVNYHFELLIVKPDGSTEILPLNEPDIWIKNMEIVCSPAGELYCIGGYSSTAEFKRASIGIVVFKLGDNGIVKSKSYVEIPIQIRAMYESGNEQKNAEKKGYMENFDLYPEKVVFDADGSLTVITRQRNVVFTNSQVYVNGGCLLLLKLNAEYHLVWARKNPVWTSGYKYFSEKGVHYIVQKDVKKNANITPEDEAAGVGHPDEFWLSASMIDDRTGELSKKYLLDLANINGLHAYRFMVNNMICTSKNDIIFEVNKLDDDKKDVLIRVGID